MTWLDPIFVLGKGHLTAKRAFVHFSHKWLVNNTLSWHNTYSLSKFNFCRSTASKQSHARLKLNAYEISYLWTLVHKVNRCYGFLLESKYWQPYLYLNACLILKAQTGRGDCDPVTENKKYFFIQNIIFYSLQIVVFFSSHDLRLANVNQHKLVARISDVTDSEALFSFKIIQ